MQVQVRVVLILMSVAWSVAAAERSPVRNFGVVVENGIYRGGQPDAKDLEWLKELGVKTILKLNTAGLEKERAACERLGLKLVHIPTKAESITKIRNCRSVEDAMQVLKDRDEWPVYVHCEHGRDRTGYIVGLYRLQVEGWSWSRVDEELASFGHVGSKRRAYPNIGRELKGGGTRCGPWYHSAEADE